MADYFYYRNAIQHIAKPCAFIDMDALKSNIQMIASASKEKKIRVASKSIRSVGMLKTILSSSDVFQGVMCFTAEEAIYLHHHGLNDLLVAYPIWNEEQLQTICHLGKEGAPITLMVDSEAHIKQLEKIAIREQGSFLVCMDIDLSSTILGIYFGVYRSPIKTVEDAQLLARRIINSDVLTLDGVMGYEAQIAGVPDADPSQKAKSQIIRSLKKRSSTELIEKRSQIIQAIEKEGANLRFINGGGTGSLQQTTKEKDVTEVTVGSGFFNSHLFDKYKDFKYKAAAFFALEITRIPSEGIYTCFGGGYVASGSVDRKSTRLNSSHVAISYAVFCLKKKT